MSSTDSLALPLWYVIHTHPKEETRAAINLKSWGVETCAPLIRERRYNQFTGEPLYRTKPLFCRYIFARFSLADSLRKVRFTRGVHSVVSFGANPVSVDEEIIAMIRARTGSDGLIELSEQINPGDEVMIRGGPLKGLVAVFERKMSDKERVMVLLNTVSYQARLVIDVELLQKAN